MELLGLIILECVLTISGQKKTREFSSRVFCYFRISSTISFEIGIPKR